VVSDLRFVVNIYIKEESFRRKEVIFFEKKSEVVAVWAE